MLGSKNNDRGQTIYKLDFSQREMTNQFDYKPFIEGMCAGVVFAFAGLFFRSSNPSKFQSNFFPTNPINPYKEFAKSCISQHQSFINHQGDIKGFVEDNFQGEIKSIEATKTIRKTLNHLDMEIQAGRTAVFMEVFLESRKAPSIIPRVSHLIGLFHVNDMYFFIEPNHGLISFDSFDEFKLWFCKETEMDGILAYLPDRIEQYTTDLSRQYQGLAKQFKGIQNVIYSCDLPLIKKPTLQTNNPLILSHSKNRYDSQQFNGRMISRL